MSDIVQDHLERVRVAVLRKNSMATLADWITRNTTIGGQNYSFLDHEYQQTIISDTSQEVNVRKCSQVGVSECSLRLALAMVSVVNPMTVIYTLPTAKFSASFVKTRIDPVISGSKVLKESVHKTNDNAEMKQFNDSFLYVRGTASTNAPISIPGDAIISDETDFSDQEVLSQYTSRLTHSKWRLIRKFSTPTVPNYGVDRAFQNSRRFFNLCKCNHCNFWFLPSYFDHVKIPDFTGDLREINKQTLTRIRWQEAVLLCPSCGKQPSLQIEHRQYVCENPTENYIGAGYQVSPFDAPNIIQTHYLVKASTDFSRAQDFVNFSLGLPMEDNEATLTRTDFMGVFIRAECPVGTCVMGVDVGNVYHFVIGIVDPWGDLLVIHTEQVHMGQVRRRYHELRNEYRVMCTVIDSGPHGETVMALQDEDPNLYAAVYIQSKTVVTHMVVEREEEADEGKSFVRQVNVNRNRALDSYMNAVREKHVHIIGSYEEETIIEHHTSMKRIRMFDHATGEMSYSWQKTDGNDHYHHAFLYCWIAGKMRALGRSVLLLPTFQAFSFRPKVSV